MKTRLVVSDTSPIRGLRAVGYEDLLPRLCGEICVPEAVVQELRFPAGNSASISVADLPFLRFVTASPTPFLEELRSRLDPGEAEAIAYAAETLSVESMTLLIDERAGRTLAMNLGLQIVGTIGLLVEAKQKGFVPEVRPIIDRMRAEFRFFISDSFYSTISRMVGESP